MNTTKRISIYLGGINGVGKTTIAKLLQNKGFSHIQCSNILLNYFELKEQKELENIPQKKKQYVMEKIIPKEIRKYTKVVIDAHYVTPLKNGKYYTKSLNSKLAHEVNYLIHLTAPPTLILNRRIRDLSNRARDLNISNICRDQLESINVAQNLSKKHSVPLIAIGNNSNPKITVNKILSEVGL